jgi:hypothetical protein
MAQTRSVQLFGGIVATLVGGAILLMVALNPDMMSEGVSPWVGILAGGVFFLTGVILVGSATRWLRNDGLVSRLLVASLLTSIAAVAMVFPPGGIVAAFLAVHGWIAVYRWLHKRVTGNDPMGSMSQEKQFGVGCLVYLALVLLLVLGLWLGGRFDPEPLPAEQPYDEIRNN